MEDELIQVIYSSHAKQRMEERSITTEQVIDALDFGTIIKEDGQLFIKKYKDIYVPYKETKDKKCVIIITTFRRSETIEQRINKIPQPNPWYSEEARETFINEAYNLVNERGFNEIEATELLTTLYKATCKEFGE